MRAFGGGAVMKKLIEMLADIRPEIDFTQSQDLIGDGYIDSFDLITLVAAIDKEYHISIKGTDITPENFASIEAIQKLLKEYGVQDEV